MPSLNTRTSGPQPYKVTFSDILISSYQTGGSAGSHANEIEVLSWSWGETNSGDASRQISGW